MTITSSIRDFVSSVWTRPSASTDAPAATPTVTPPARPAPGVGAAPTTFDRSTPPAGPVLSPEAKAKKIAERVAGMMQAATTAKLEGDWADNPPESVKTLTREEQRQILDYANQYDAKLANWVKTSDFVRDSRPMTPDEHEAYFERTTFDPGFNDLVETITNKSVGRFNQLQDIATELKGQPLTAEDQKIVGGLSHLFDAKLAEWAKTSELTKGTQVMPRHVLEQRFMQDAFVPMFRERMAEIFKANG